MVESGVLNFYPVPDPRIFQNEINHIFALLKQNLICFGRRLKKISVFSETSKRNIEIFWRVTVLKVLALMSHELFCRNDEKIIKWLALEVLK